MTQEYKPEWAKKMETVGPIIQFALWISIVVTVVVTFFDFLKIFSPEWE